MNPKDDSFNPISTPRAMDTLAMRPHCRGTIDVTVETARARIEIISLLWDAFCERGADIELDLEQLRNDLEVNVLQRTRGTAPSAAFCETTTTRSKHEHGTNPQSPRRQRNGLI